MASVTTLLIIIIGDLLSELEESAVPGRREIIFSRPAVQTLWDTRKCTTEAILKIKQRESVKYKHPPPLSLFLKLQNCNYCTYMYSVISSQASPHLHPLPIFPY